MKHPLFLTILAGYLLISTQPYCAQQTETPSFVNETTINAPVSELWKVWSTSQGYKLLGPAMADVDFRIGGLIRSRYSATGVLGDEQTIENRILAYEPMRMIAIRIDKPPKGFPFKEAWKKTWTVITMTETAPNRTHLRVASMGFGPDEESISMRRFFEVGNAATLATLLKQIEAKSATDKGNSK